MARYDDDTQSFMDQTVRSTRSVAKQLAKGKSLKEALVRQAIAIPTFAALEKQGQASMTVMQVFKLLNEHYNFDWWEWAPETIWQTLKQDHDIEASESVKNIIQALQVIVKTNQAFEHWHVFEKIGQAFSSNPVNFGHMQPLELDEISFAIKVLNTIRPKTEYDEEIKAYIGACAKKSGVVYLPDELFMHGCQLHLDQLGNNDELRDLVIASLNKPYIKDETALSIQLQRLDEIRNYAEKEF